MGNGTLHRRRSNRHCRSSGYESSAADSLESPREETKASSMKEEEERPTELTLCQDLGTLPPLRLVRYEEEEVKRMDGRFVKRINNINRIETVLSVV